MQRQASEWLWKANYNSVGDNPEEEEETVQEQRPDGQGGCQVQGRALNK